MAECALSLLNVRTPGRRYRLMQTALSGARVDPQMCKHDGRVHSDTRVARNHRRGCLATRAHNTPFPLSVTSWLSRWNGAFVAACSDSLGSSSSSSSHYGCNRTRAERERGGSRTRSAASYTSVPFERPFRLASAVVQCCCRRRHTSLVLALVMSLRARV